ncbi:adenosylcobinamide-phosphate synthase CbiB [Lysinibacillus sp. BW-2-10]|uniref:adenosylcobinamide-phosphate synthase CbiB n=1 Tax=Lysinibacillus sp. BW-2-10 TaxID=2590030 RepID=UPI00118062B3|nr:adenosylcobinamide-phosphate synthase CbiB [Lysinibacillus sp. BW-2-10]TSI10144.1 cobalamin biosynthesis protein CobD [Lysinibacillus sp. BW-2-10]
MHILAVFLGQLLDIIIGDPPKLPHPIRWIGNFIAFLSKKLNQGNSRTIKGAIMAFIVVGTVTVVTFSVVYLSYTIHFVVGLLIETILIAIGLAQKSLKEAAMVVYDALKRGDLDEARVKLSWIVGRDTAHLEEPEIVRGVVETVSENTSDGITAPLFYAILFGATGLWTYKAINTLDSMVGYKNDTYMQFGKVSARLDDMANFIPSRITGLLILLFTKNKTNRPLKERFTNWLVDAKKHPSPNSGYLEAATAYQLGIRLGGYNTYKGIMSFRAYMGKPTETLQASHIKEAITHMFIVSWVFILIVGGVHVAISLAWR